jgi:tripartite-type tricarboxylate transporter receptor subunit TctC
MIRHRRSVLVGTFALALFFLAGGARAQGWPTRPVTMVVPYPAGGPVDTVGRIMAAGLSEILGQQVVIENVTGAGGMTGTSRVALAAPDGYTFLLGGLAVLGLVPNLYKKPPYNPVTDFAPVSLFADSARILIARKDLPADTLKDFIAYAQTNQAKMQFGSAGAGSGLHICAVLLNTDMGTTITHVPYRGSAPAMQDLMPEAIVRRLAQATSGAVDLPLVRERFASVGVTVAAPERRSPEYLAKFLPSELAKWAGPIRASGVSAD